MKIPSLINLTNEKQMDYRGMNIGTGEVSANMDYGEVSGANRII
jgi:hypothetical protein